MGLTKRNVRHKEGETKNEKLLHLKHITTNVKPLKENECIFSMPFIILHQ